MRCSSRCCRRSPGGIPTTRFGLGHATVWEETEEGEEVPFGQKMLLVDGEEIPILEVRSVRIAAKPQAAATEGVG